MHNRSKYSTGWGRLVYFPPATSIPRGPGEGSGWGGYSIVGSEERNFPGLGPHLSYSPPPKWTRMENIRVAVSCLCYQSLGDVVASAESPYLQPVDSVQQGSHILDFRIPCLTL